jgi:3'(2'), 5'-bisphosphate nucleotidase
MIEVMIKAAKSAGEAILALKNCTAQFKADYSPVTKADLASNAIIMRELTHHFSHIPIVSEETACTCDCDTFFLIDPLDGTKEFLQNNGEYCVLIAYIEQGIPVKSVIYAPDSGYLYVANEGKATKNGVPIHVKAGLKNALISRSHPEEPLVKYHETKGVSEFITCGSALKFAKLAEGEAGLYTRFVSLSIWDIAAGDALVNAAGGTMTDHEGKNLTYHSSHLKAKPFIAKSN